MPPPVPPSVKLGRMTAGRPVMASAARASSSEWAMAERGDSMPISAIASRNFSRSSARSMTSALAPINSTPCRASAPLSSEFHRGVERGLPAHRRQQRVGFLAGDDFFDDLGGDRLDVGGVGEAGIGHDGGGVGVHQDDAVALGFQGLAGLRAGVVELAGLADDDRAGADDHDGVDVGAFGHSMALLVNGNSGAVVVIGEALELEGNCFGPI